MLLLLPKTASGVSDVVIVSMLLHYKRFFARRWPPRILRDLSVFQIRDSGGSAQDEAGAREGIGQ